MKTTVVQNKTPMFGLAIVMGMGMWCCTTSLVYAQCERDYPVQQQHSNSQQGQVDYRECGVGASNPQSQYQSQAQESSSAYYPSQQGSRVNCEEDELCSTGKKETQAELSFVSDAERAQRFSAAAKIGRSILARVEKAPAQVQANLAEASDLIEAAIPKAQYDAVGHSIASLESAVSQAISGLSLESQDTVGDMCGGGTYLVINNYGKIQRAMAAVSSYFPSDRAAAQSRRARATAETVDVLKAQLNIIVDIATLYSKPSLSSAERDSGFTGCQ